MDNQLLTILKRKLDELAVFGSMDAETQRNVAKEELQYYVLNFIYHHADYGNWIMYGGSALRICHGLNRMSVDLDFEIDYPCADNFLNDLKAGLQEYFANTHGVGADVLSIKIVRSRGLLLRFAIGGQLGIKHPSGQVHVKIDLNYFVAPKTFIERIPISHDQLAFVILTYNMSTLMASKIAAIFLRGKRGIGEAIYEEKGRDIYDLLWYMDKKVIPNMDYLVAKDVDTKEIRVLFKNLTIKMNGVSDANLKQDLEPLFVDRPYIQDWLNQWRESYLRLVEAYNIHVVGKLRKVIIHEDFMTSVFSFSYEYGSEDGGSVWIRYAISDYWLLFREGDLPTRVDPSVILFVPAEGKEGLSDKTKQYATLFEQKTEAYLKKTGRVVLGDSIETKTIRMTADNLNQKEQIVLDKSALLLCGLKDLLK